MVIKRKIESFFIFPFIVIGRLIAMFRPIDTDYEIYFFFPFYHTGGAEKFNMAVSNAVKGRKAIIIFTRKSINTTFLEEFRNSGHRIMDISRFTDNKAIYFMNLVYRGIMTGYINKQRIPTVVFNGQCNFAYKIAPWVKKEVTQLEFIHTFNTFSYIRTPFLSYYYKTISSSNKTINDHKTFYKEIGVPAEYAPRFEFILYGIILPPKEKRNDLTTPVLHILFAGRGTYEKRVHIVATMAKMATEQGLPVQFDFLGDVKQGIPAPLVSFCNLLGNRSGFEEIFSIYRSCHILVVSSAFEGFPFVVMEAMSQGLAILSTPVGDVPYHVKNDVNGYIIPELQDETRIEEEGLAFIKKMISNRELLQRIAAQNQEDAYAKFEISVFNKNYQSLFDSLLNK